MRERREGREKRERAREGHKKLDKSKAKRTSKVKLEQRKREVALLFPLLKLKKASNKKTQETKTQEEERERRESKSPNSPGVKTNSMGGINESIIATLVTNQEDAITDVERDWTSLMSSTSTSYVRREMRRPMGVLSKNDMGAFRVVATILIQIVFCKKERWKKKGGRGGGEGRVRRGEQERAREERRN